MRTCVRPLLGTGGGKPLTYTIVALKATRVSLSRMVYFFGRNSAGGASGRTGIGGKRGVNGRGGEGRGKGDKTRPSPIVLPGLTERKSVSDLQHGVFLERKRTERQPKQYAHGSSGGKNS